MFSFVLCVYCACLPCLQKSVANLFNGLKNKQDTRVCRVSCDPTDPAACQEVTTQIHDYTAVVKDSNGHDLPTVANGEFLKTKTHTATCTAAYNNGPGTCDGCTGPNSPCMLDRDCASGYCGTCFLCWVCLFGVFLFGVFVRVFVWCLFGVLLFGCSFRLVFVCLVFVCLLGQW